MAVNSPGGFPPVSPVSASKASRDVFGQQPASGRQVEARDERRQRRDRRQQERRRRDSPVLLDRRQPDGDRRRKSRRRAEMQAGQDAESSSAKGPDDGGLDLYA